MEICIWTWGDAFSAGHFVQTRDWSANILFSISDFRQFHPHFVVQPQIWWAIIKKSFPRSIRFSCLRFFSRSSRVLQHVKQAFSLCVKWHTEKPAFQLTNVFISVFYYPEIVVSSMKVRPTNFFFSNAKQMFMCLCFFFIEYYEQLGWFCIYFILFHTRRLCLINRKRAEIKHATASILVSFV